MSRSASFLSPKNARARGRFCTAITKRGRGCVARCVPGSDRCKLHGGAEHLAALVRACELSTTRRGVPVDYDGSDPILCNAVTISGGKCRALGLPLSGRCRHHGGSLDELEASTQAHKDAQEKRTRANKSAYAKRLRRTDRVICGARRRRDGKPCQVPSVPGKQRCRWHGGLSTGPRTAEGKRRVSLNLHRRHLSESQRAMVAARIANLSHGQKRADTAIAVTQSEAAASIKVSEDSIQRARKVIAEGTPELVEAVERGMVAAKLATLGQGARTDLAPIGGMSQAQAAKLLNVGERTVERAAKVKDEGAPELVEGMSPDNEVLRIVVANCKKPLLATEPPLLSERRARDRELALAHPVQRRGAGGWT